MKRPPPRRVRLRAQDGAWQVVDASTGLPLHQGTIDDRGIDAYLTMNRMVVVSKPSPQCAAGGAGAPRAPEVAGTGQAAPAAAQGAPRGEGG